MITVSLTYLLDSADAFVEAGYVYSDIMQMEYWEFIHIFKRLIEKDKKRKAESEDEKRNNSASFAKQKQKYKPKKYK